MRKTVLFSVFIGLMLFVINISGSLLSDFQKDSVQDTSISSQSGIVSVLSAGDVYADSNKDRKKDRDRKREKRKKRDKKNKKDKKDKKKKKRKKDKGKGPSLPALPMVSSIVLGLGAIGWGRYLIKKRKG